jgi:hypothetical protein
VLLLHAFLLFSLLLIPLLLVSLLLLTFLLIPLLLVSPLLLTFLLIPLLLVSPLLLTFLLLLVSLLLLTFLLFPLLLVSLLSLTFLLFPLLLLLLLIGLPKHYLRKNRNQGKAKQKHRCLPGLSKCGCNYREKNGLTRQTFRHSCRFGVDGVAFDEDFRETLREDRSRDTLHNHLVAALHRKDTLEQRQCAQRLGKEMLGKGGGLAHKTAKMLPPPKLTHMN